MIRVIDDSSTGKTGRLMLLAKENKGTIVCSNPSAMRYKAYEYGLTGINFVSYADFINGTADIEGNVYIDELETMVKSLISMTYADTTSFEGYTISKE